MENLNFEYEDLGPIWHLCTPGEFVGVIFKDRDDYVFGMNLVALCAANFSTQLKILTFQIMSNHLHFVIECEEPVIGEFFAFLKKRLQRYLANSGHLGSLSGFIPNYFRINELRYLQNVIVYVNRNGYVARHDCTPYTYPWGAGIAIFNSTTRLLPSTRYSKLTVRQKRDICKSKDIDLPGDLLVYGSVILPSSYCALQKTEQFFRSPHHYFSLLSKNWEAYSEIAKRLGETMIITDEEMYGAVSALSAKEFGIKNPRLLAANSKIELARRMKTEFYASPKQIRNILKLDQGVIDELFGNFA
jgi:REP element-mobilizing transposase RayT